MKCLNKKCDGGSGRNGRRNVSLARIIPVIEVPLQFRTRIATPRLNAPWEGVADGASGFHGNAASTAPTLRTGVVPTRVESVAAHDGGGSDGGAAGTKGDGNRPSGTVTVGASPFDAACWCVLFYGVIEKNLARIYGSNRETYKQRIFDEVFYYLSVIIATVIITDIHEAKILRCFYRLSII